jgi:hypothetical protein
MSTDDVVVAKFKQAASEIWGQLPPEYRTNPKQAVDYIKSAVVRAYRAGKLETPAEWDALKSRMLAKLLRERTGHNED